MKTEYVERRTKPQISKTRKVNDRRHVSAGAPNKKRWTFKKSERPAGWTEELEREWEESGPHVYDKAKWHYEGDYPKGLPRKQAFVYTGLFLAWLIDQDMISRDFTRQLGRDLRSVSKRFEQRKTTGPQAYRIWGGCLDSDMLTPGANDFAQHYYDSNQFAKDYGKLLATGLPSWYHVQDTWANFDILKRKIDARYENWKNPRQRKKAKRAAREH